MRVVTNLDRVLDPRVRRLLGFGDERVVRVDAGGDRVERPRRPLVPEALAAALAELSGYTVEAVFVAGPGGNAGRADVDAWIEHMAALGPSRVFVTTPAEPPVDSRMQRIEVARLERIAERLRERTGIAGVTVVA